jgi:hypothetical protein
MSTCPAAYRPSRWASRPSRWIVGLAPLALAALLGAADTAEAAEKREVKDKNFTWQLPNADWSWVEPDAGQREAGYALGAQCGLDGGVQAWARVVQAAGMSAQDMAEEIRSELGKDLAKAGASQVGAGRLSGLSGALVALSGEQAGGTAWWCRVWVVKSSDMLHQLVVQAYRGAETKHGAAIETLRRAYRLIEGAGPDEAGSDPKFRAEDPMGGGPGRTEFPAGGPKQEGRTAIFPSHNLRWTLPEGGPFTWQNATDDEKGKEQQLIQAVARQPRKSEGAGDPTDTACVVSAFVQPLQPGVTAELVVQNPANQEIFTKAIFDGKIDSARTKIDIERKVGNHTGASLMLAGGEDKVARVFVLVIVTLQQTMYEFRVQMIGGKDVMRTWGEPVGALIGGIEFPNTTEPIAGPLAVEGIGVFSGPRGHSIDKEVERPLPGATAKKPKGLAEIPIEGNDPTMRLTWEARSADGQAYLWFDVRSWSLTDTAVQRRKLEDWMTDRESQWKAGAGSDAFVGKGKQSWSDGSFGTAKGLTYRYTGSLRDVPFVEQGWVVKAKNSILFLRAQFGGANAEKTMEAQMKAIKKGIKFQ